MHIILKMRINVYILIFIFNNVLTLIHFVQEFYSRKEHANRHEKIN